MARVVNESDNAVILSPDGYPIRPSRIPAEFKLVMTQERKDLRKIMTELMFEYDQKHCR